MDIEILAREIDEILAERGVESDTNEIAEWLSDRDLEFLDSEVEVLVDLFLLDKERKG